MSTPPAGKSLSKFLRTHAAEILQAWDDFAGTIELDGKPLDRVALRDHAAELLAAIATDMERPQTDSQQQAKSEGDGTPQDPGLPDTAAETHADTRMTSGFAILPMLTEYRALRASVLRLWSDSADWSNRDEVAQITRFNEAIDQAILESVCRYTERTKQSNDLFIGVLGHDIRNPLGTILMSTQYLVRAGRLDDTAARPILNSTRRIASIVEQVVDFTRAQAGSKMPLEPAPADLGSLARDIVEETQIRHPDVVIRLVAGGASLAGRWDPGRIGQLLSNLLANAITHGDRAQPVLVSLEGDASDVVVEVQNSGPVIPADQCGRIFEPLVRGMGLSQRLEPSGLGLGLYICREIAHAHGGHIAVRSDAQGGTRFIVSLPRDGAAAVAELH
jgi:signal transduction histidine kinase